MRAVPWFGVLAAACLLAPSSAAVAQSAPAGSYVHGPSAFTFPETIGRFRRTAVRPLDAAGEGMVVGYDLDEPDAQVALTLYVYRPLVGADGHAVPFDEAFRQERAAILRVNPNARVSAPWTPPTTQNGEDLRQACTFHFQDVVGGRSLALESLLYLFRFDGWTVKYRITYPLSQRTLANVIAQAFVSGFRWRTVDSERP